MELKFFNKIAVAENSARDFSAVTIEDADERSLAILKTISPVVTSTLEFNKVSDLADLFIKQKSYYAEAYRAVTDDRIIEVVDTPPENVGILSKDFSINRVIYVYDRKLPDEKKDSVFMVLSANEAPNINVFASANSSNSGFINKGSNASSVVKKAQTIIDTINDKLPSPSWVKSFDETYEIKNGHILKKSPQP